MPGKALNVGSLNGKVSVSDAGLTVAGTPTLVSGNTYRYAVTGNASAGSLTITLAPGWTDSAGNAGTGATASITLDAPLAQIITPTGAVSPAELTSGGIVVTFFPVPGQALNVGSLNGKVTTSNAGLTVAGTPTLVSGTTYRYTVTGTAAPGPLTITLAAGWTDSAGNAGTGATASVNVAVPSAQIVTPIGAVSPAELTSGGIVVTFVPVPGKTLNVASLTGKVTVTGGLTVAGTPTLVSGNHLQVRRHRHRIWPAHDHRRLAAGPIARAMPASARRPASPSTRRTPRSSRRPEPSARPN